MLKKKMPALLVIICNRGQAVEEDADMFLANVNETHPGVPELLWAGALSVASSFITANGCNIDQNNQRVENHISIAQMLLFIICYVWYSLLSFSIWSILSVWSSHLEFDLRTNTGVLVRSLGLYLRFCVTRRYHIFSSDICFKSF